MANATVAVGTYAGEAARPYVAAAILSADSIANNYVSVLENVHSKAVLRKFSGAAISAASCEFTTTAGQLTLGEAVLDATALQVNEQVCNKDLRATWESAQMRGQSSSAPADFQTFVAQYVAAKVAENIEINLWGGNFDPTDSAVAAGEGVTLLGTSFDGLYHHIVDASASLGYDGEVGGAFTADTHATTGILTHLDALVANAPSAVQSDANANIYMSRKSLFLLQRAMAGIGIFSGDATAGIGGVGYSPEFVGAARPTTFLGFNVVAASGCPNDTLLLCNPNQIYFGTDLLTDHIQASVLDLTGVTGDDVTRVIMRFSGGTQIVDAGSLAVIRRTS